MKKLILYGILCTTPSLLVPLHASDQKESPEAVLRAYLKTSWPTGKLDATKMTKLLENCFKKLEPFGFAVKKEHCFFTPQDNSSYYTNIRNWWEKTQVVYRKLSVTAMINSITEKNFDYYTHIKDLYKIHIMPLCKKELSTYSIDYDNAIDILITLFKLINDDQYFRKCIESFKFQNDLKPLPINALAPCFVIYVLDGKKSAQYALSILTKKLPFKAATADLDYLTLPHNIPVDSKQFPGLFYAQGDSDFKGPSTVWRDDVYDKSTGYALFNPKFVGAKNSKELVLALPKKNMFGF